MKNLKYLTLVPGLGAPAVGSYLMVSTPGVENAAPKETPIAELPPNQEGAEVPIVDGPKEAPANPEASQPKPAEAPRALDNPPKAEAEPSPAEAKDPEPRVDVRAEEKAPEDLPKQKMVEEENDCEADSTCEMIERLGEGSVGKRYRQHLIGSRHSSHWSKKIDTWRLNNGLNKNDAPFKMRDNASSDVLKNSMVTRCETAYRRNSFNDGTIKGKKLEKEQYWGMVWTYCSKPLASQPQDWGQVS